MEKATSANVIQKMQSGDLDERVRRLISSGTAEIEQAGQQRQKPTILEIRCMEFDLAQKIIETVRKAENKPT